MQPFLSNHRRDGVPVAKSALRHRPPAAAHPVMQNPGSTWCMVVAPAVGRRLALGITVPAPARVLAGVFVTLAVLGAPRRPTRAG